MWRSISLLLFLASAQAAPVMAEQPAVQTPITTQPATVSAPRVDESGRVENPPEKLQLAYRFEKGKANRYQVQIMNRGSYRLLNQKEEIALDTVTEVFLRQTVKSEEPDGLYKVEWAMLSGIVRIPGFGQSVISVPELTYTVDERGNVKKISGLEKMALLPGKPQQKTFATILGEFRFQGFPKQELKVGDTWTHDYTLDIPDNEKVTVKVNSKLLAYEKCDGYDCARIETKYDYPIKFVLNDKVNGRLVLEGKESGTVITFFAFKEGKMIRTEGDIASDAKVAESNGKVGDAFVKLQLNIVSRLLPKTEDKTAEVR